MSYYIYGPTDKMNFMNLSLKKCVELIGIQQVGKGSLDAKGRRYIKSQVKCSNRAIKKLYSSRINLFVQYDNLGTYAFSFHSEFTADILKTIIDYINSNLSKRQQEIFEEYFHCKIIDVNTIFSDQRLCLDYIVRTNYRGQGIQASNIISQINNA